MVQTQAAEVQLNSFHRTGTIDFHLEAQTHLDLYASEILLTWMLPLPGDFEVFLRNTADRAVGWLCHGHGGWICLRSCPWYSSVYVGIGSGSFHISHN